MALTVAYSYTNVKPEFSAFYDNISNANDTNPSLVALSNGNFYMADQWQSLQTPTNTSIIGELYNSSATNFLGSVGGISGSYNNITNSDPAVTQLANGNVLTTWTLPSGIHYYLSNPNNNGTVKTDTLLPGTDGNDISSDVAALKNGGFALVKQDNFNATDQDADLLIYTANGTLVTSIALGSNSSLDEQHPTVAVMNNGNIVVAYEKEKADNTDTFGISIEIFKQDGTRVLNPTMFDSVGDNNLRPDVVALKDGGFAIAYQDDGWGQPGLSVAFFNSDGVLRGIQRADTDSAPDNDPSITVLANGNVAVTWTDGYSPADLNIAGAVFDPNTMQRLGQTYAVENQSGNQSQSSIIGLADGTQVTAWTDVNNAITDGNTDPNGTHISLQIDAWTRTTTGASASETFRGDGLRDVFTSGGGADTFVYGRGGHADTINGFVAGAGSDSRIVLSGFSGVQSFSDVALRASQSGADTVLDFGSGDVLTLKNVTRTNLTADDFVIRTFDDGVSLASPSFGSDASAGGWSNQNLTPRVMADVNGDGKADIVGFGESATYVSLATATGFAGANVGINSFGFSAAGGGWASNDTFHRTLGDVNGDGKADIIGFGNSGVYVSLATSSGQFASPSLKLSLFGIDASAGGWSSDDALPREVADTNGDGMDDIVGFGNSGVWIALATGNGNFSAPFLSLASFGKDASAGGWASDTQYHRELADVNGDGMADIVGFGSSTTYIALATGGGHFAAPQIAVSSFGYAAAGGGWSTQDQYPRHLADVNADGRADIVGFGDSATYISYGNADGTFSSPTADIASFGRTPAAGGWASDSTLPRMLADVDGNGAADIVGFGNGGVYVAHSNVNWLG